MAHSSRTPSGRDWEFGEPSHGGTKLRTVSCMHGWYRVLVRSTVCHLWRERVNVAWSCMAGA